MSSAASEVIRSRCCLRASTPGRSVTIKISEEVSTKKLAEVLEENGLVEDAKVFQFQMKMADFEGPVKAGTYELNTSMSPSKMFKILSSNGDET